MFLNHIRIILIAILCVPIIKIHGSDHEKFMHKTISNTIIDNETEISLYKDNQLIGFVRYTKIPLISTYVIHTLYVYPQYRKNGFGSELLNYLCDYLKKQKAKKAYIQPGAFELGYKDPDEVRELKTKMLVEWYQKFGFTPVDLVTAKAAIILYKMLGIHENSNYLLRKNLNTI